MSAASFDAFFLPREGGSRFCILHTPVSSAAPKGAVLYVHPFAEEMNKSRRTVALTARGLAEDGWVVMLLDLLGCGDSSGDFGAASWELWLDDIALAYHWLTDRYGSAPVLWGLRTGCLLITDLLKRLPAQPHLMFWQPVMSGKVFLNQFLRLRAAAEMLGEQQGRTSTKALREQLAKGDVIEIAGYALSSSLALPLESAELEITSGYSGRVMWCEVTPCHEGAALSPAAGARIERWRKCVAELTSEAVVGLPFWQTQEIAECPAIEQASRRFMNDLAP